MTSSRSNPTILAATRPPASRQRVVTWSPTYRQFGDVRDQTSGGTPVAADSFRSESSCVLFAVLVTASSRCLHGSRGPQRVPHRNRFPSPRSTGRYLRACRRPQPARQPRHGQIDGGRPHVAHSRVVATPIRSSPSVPWSPCCDAPPDWGRPDLAGSTSLIVLTPWRGRGGRRSHAARPRQRVRSWRTGCEFASVSVRVHQVRCSRSQLSCLTSWKAPPPSWSLSG